MTKTMKASEFKAKCLALLDDVEENGSTIVVTKNGRPVAQVSPYQPIGERSLIGIWKDRIKINGDIISPLDVEWDAMK